MATPVVVVSGAMAVAPGLMTAQVLQVHQTHQTHQAPAHTGPRTVTANLDASVQPAARSYTVRAGDTLYAIALRYYGQGKYWPGLYWANRSKISHPDLIWAGQVLTIPSLQVVATAPDRSTWDRARWDRATSGQSKWDQSTSGKSTPAPSTADMSSAATTKSSQGSTSTQSSSGEGSTVQADIADGNYLLAIGQYLVDNGYSKAAAAGVASCVDGESGGNPESVGSGGGGLIGWTPLGSAAPDANIVTGNAAQDMATQLADILYYNSHEIGQSAVDELNSQTDPVLAADFYSQHFERPAVTDSDVVPSVAEQIYSELGG